jgi:hypothetical protein
LKCGGWGVSSVVSRKMVVRLRGRRGKKGSDLSQWKTFCNPFFPKLHTSVLNMETAYSSEASLHARLHCDTIQMTIIRIITVMKTSKLM